MRYEFTEKDILDEVNKMELEGEDVTLIAQFVDEVENEENTYLIIGDAVIEGELYHDFVTMVGLAEIPEEISARAIAMAPWDWFDYVCD